MRTRAMLACRAKRRKNAREHRPDLSWVGCSLLLTILLPPTPCSLPLIYLLLIYFKKKNESGPISRVLYLADSDIAHILFCEVPAIYLLRRSPCVSSVLPSIAATLRHHRAGNPDMAMVYMNLQPPDGTARRSPDDW